MNRRSAAYTLIEVLIAAAILVVAVAGAAAMALATVSQEEMNARIARCVNLHEQAVRLYQLGLAPDTVNAVLPYDPAVVNQPVFTVASPNLTIANLGTVEEATSTLTYTTSDASGATRTSTILAIRPSLR